jgi:hypothetical protein
MLIIVRLRTDESRVFKSANRRELPAQTFCLLSHFPPIVGRFPEHSRGFGVGGFVRQLVALAGLVAKIL